VETESFPAAVALVDELERRIELERAAASADDAD
jgi:hypothetical protein